MAEETTILQHWIFSKFVLPFLFIFVIVYAILEKTKIFGDEKHQLNAIISVVVGLIFVGILYPTTVLNNMILFMTISLITVFVALLLWGFITGKAELPQSKVMRLIAGIAIIIAVAVALLWALGVSNNILDFLFGQGWSSSFWTNFLFVVVIIVALVLVLSGGKKS